VGLVEQLQALAEPALAPGEEILGIVRVNYNGTMQPNATSMNASFGALGEAPDEDMLVAFPSAKIMGLVLTGGRLLVWAMGMRAKPKAFIGEVPLSAISALHAGAIRVGPLMRIVMKSGATVDLEIPHNEAGGDAFIEQFRFLVGEGSDSRHAEGDAPVADAAPATLAESDPPAAPADDAAAADIDYREG
jgi:hypothetical protein